MEAQERQKSLEKHLQAQQYVSQQYASDSDIDDLKAMKAKARAEDLLDVLTPEEGEVRCSLVELGAAAAARVRSGARCEDARIERQRTTSA